MLSMPCGSFNAVARSKPLFQESIEHSMVGGRSRRFAHDCGIRDPEGNRRTISRELR